MIANLIKIEESIKKIRDSKIVTDYILDLASELGKERLSYYKTEDVFFSALNKDKEAALLNKLDIFERMTVRSKSVEKMFSTVKLDSVYGKTNLVKKELFELINKDYFFDPKDFKSEVFVRPVSMKDSIIKDILKGECCSLFTEGSKEVCFGNVKFVFDVKMLNEEDYESIQDICKNLKAYLKHPDIGEITLKKELENTLDKYYNTNLIYIKNTKENCIYEIEVA